MLSPQKALENHTVMIDIFLICHKSPPNNSQFSEKGDEYTSLSKCFIGFTKTLHEGVRFSNC